MSAANQTAGLHSSLAADHDLAELIELFVSEVPQRVAKLQGDFQRADWEQLGRTAHQLKGAAGSYGFPQLTPAAAQLEFAARNGQGEDEILRCLVELAELCGQLRAGLPEAETSGTSAQ